MLAATFAVPINVSLCHTDSQTKENYNLISETAINGHLYKNKCQNIQSNSYQ